MHLYYSNFVKAFRSMYTRITQFFEKILAQGENKNFENKKDNNLSTNSGQENLEGNNLAKQKQSKTSGTIKGNNIRAKKGKFVSDTALRKPK